MHGYQFSLCVFVKLFEYSANIKIIRVITQLVKPFAVVGVSATVGPLTPMEDTTSVNVVICASFTFFHPLDCSGQLSF